MIHFDDIYDGFDVFLCVGLGLIVDNMTDPNQSAEALKKVCIYTS